MNVLEPQNRLQKTISREKNEMQGGDDASEEAPYSATSPLNCYLHREQAHNSRKKRVMKEEDEHLLYWQFLPMYSPGHSQE